MTKQIRLSQVLALEKGAKNALNTEGGNVDKASQKPDHFTGLIRNYKPLDAEDPEKVEGEVKNPTQFARTNLGIFQDLFVKLVDITACKDVGNATARADIVVSQKGNDFTVAKQIPVVTLLWLEKQLDDYHTIVKNLPTIPIDRKYSQSSLDNNLYMTEPVLTSRNKKAPKVLVRSEATDKHPAVTEVYQVDVTVGTWENTYINTGIPTQEKREMLERVVLLKEAVKKAREECNATKVTEQALGNCLVDWVVGRFVK